LLPKFEVVGNQAKFWPLNFLGDLQMFRPNF